MCIAPGRRAHVLLDAREPVDERVERLLRGRRLGGEHGGGLVQPCAEPAFDRAQPLAEDAVERGDLLETPAQQDDRLVVGDQPLGQSRLLRRERLVHAARGRPRSARRRPGSRVRASIREPTAPRSLRSFFAAPSIRRRSSVSSDSRAAASVAVASSSFRVLAVSAVRAASRAAAPISCDEPLDSFELGAVDRGGPRLLRGLKLRRGSGDVVEPLAQIRKTGAGSALGVAGRLAEQCPVRFGEPPPRRAGRVRGPFRGRPAAPRALPGRRAMVWRRCRPRPRSHAR